MFNLTLYGTLILFNVHTSRNSNDLLRCKSRVSFHYGSIKHVVVLCDGYNTSFTNIPLVLHVIYCNTYLYEHWI